MELHPGLFFFQSYLDSERQRQLWNLCDALASGSVPMYTPTVRGGRKRGVGMLCLGRHWNAMTYRYEDCRSDFDNLRVPLIPDEMRTLAEGAAADAGFSMRADLCIMNRYSAD